MVFHFAQDGAGVAMADTLAVADMEYILYTAFQPFLSYLAQDWQFLDVTVWNVTQGVLVGSLACRAGWNTTPPRDTSDALPPGVAYLVKWPTGFSKSIGKKFIYGVPEVRTANGYVNAATLVALATFAARFILILFSQDTVRRWRAGAMPKGTILKISFRAFLGALVDTQLAYQRRRKFGIGS